MRVFVELEAVDRARMLGYCSQLDIFAEVEDADRIIGGRRGKVLPCA